MATANFLVINSDGYYTFSDDNFDEVVSDMIYMSVKDGFSTCKHEHVHSMSDAVKLCDKVVYEEFGNKKRYNECNDFHFTCELYARSGYYGGNVFDWDIALYYDGRVIRCSEYSNEHFDEFIDYVSDLWKDYARWQGWNEGLIKLHKRNFEKWLEKKIISMGQEMDAIFEKCCEKELVVAARFSNGETIYHEKI